MLISSVQLWAAVVFHILLGAALYVNHAVPNAYMDEIFHVPQTQHYCAGHWHVWDPKITTFPGLYIVGVAYSKMLDATQSWLGVSDPHQEACALGTLRSVNVLQGLCCWLLLYALVQQIHGAAVNKTTALLWASALSLYPLHFFFVPLYYTDVGALTWLLLAYWLCLRRQYTVAAVASVVAVAFRQTNAVWVAWLCAVGIMAQAGPPSPDTREQHKGTLLVKHIVHIATPPLTIVPVCFACFVYHNGGVVVGDRSAHAPTAHCMQPLYCVGWITLALLPVVLTQRRLSAVTNTLTRAPIACACLGMCIAWVVHTSSLAHPYLLADNRHYTFYLWRKIINPTRWARYALVPAYLASMLLLFQSLVHTTSPLWVLSVWVGVCLTAIPAWLLELRYFTVPLVLCALHIPPPSSLRLLLLLLLYALVNVGTLYVFVEHPFLWPDGSVARFMW